MKIEKLRLKKMNNTRDLGGFPAADGKKIKRGRLLRSGRLHDLPEETIKKLEAMNIDNIIDMRTETEIKEHMPTILEGVEYHYLPLVCTATPGITTGNRSMAGTMMQESKRIKSEFGTADNYMTCMYNFILFEEESRKKLRTIFDLFLKEEKCILWHCNGGKDRTGIVAMLIEGVLGVDKKLIVEDYVISHRFQRRRRGWQKFGLMISPIPLRFKHILYALMAAKPQYITGAIDEIEKRYGSIEGYVKGALGLTDADIKVLKDKYLE